MKPPLSFRLQLLRAVLLSWLAALGWVLLLTAHPNAVAASANGVVCAGLQSEAR